MRYVRADNFATFVNNRIDYSSDGTGILPIARGGTGASVLPDLRCGTMEIRCPPPVRMAKYSF